MGYIKDAKHYYLLAQYDWINRVLKNKENTKKSIEPKKRLF